MTGHHTAMENLQVKFQQEFIDELEKYFSGGGEASLSEAYELGRRAIESGLGELEVVNIYHEALRVITDSKNDGKHKNNIPLAVNFITECLAPFEMRQMGFRELILKLENQNDLLQDEIERRNETEVELRKNKEYFQHLIENALDIITILNYDGTVRFESPSVERLLGFTPEELEGEQVMEYVHPDDRDKILQKLEGVIREQYKVDSATFRFKHKDGTWRYLESVAQNVIDAGDEPGVIVNSRDVTERVTARKELERSEKQLARAQEIGQVGSWEWDIVQDSIYWSDQMCRIYGVTRDNYPGSFDAFLEHLHPDDREYTRKIIGEAFQKGGNYAFEHRIILPDGSQKTLYGRGELVANERGEPVKMIGTGQDITQIKEAEKKLVEYSKQLKKLTEKREKVREEERTRIARELHDELGQMLTVLKMDISLTISKSRKKFGDEVISEIEEELSTIVNRIDTIIRSVQRITLELRPEVLDNLELHEALEWQVQEFKKRAGIQVIFQNEAGPLGYLEGERATAVFRVLQEALTNILRHAKATKVTIALQRKNGSLLLTVQDNGVGITRDDIKDSTSLGLIGMRERCEFLSGKFSINGSPGKGTQVSVEFPIYESNDGE